MNTEQLLEATKELVAIPSTADNAVATRAAYDYMLAFVRQRKPEITIEEFERDGIKSFLAYKGSSRPEKFDVLFNGHIDVVTAKPEQFKAHIADGNLYGRGVYDMKAACIIMAEVFCEVVDEVPYNLALQIVTDEESGSYHGVSLQVEQGVRADFVICGECGRSTSAHEIANEAKGVTFISVKFSGKTAHGAYPWKGNNAAVTATKFVNAILDRYPVPTEESHEATITVTGIVADTGVFNRVPGETLVKLDARFVQDDPRFESPDAVISYMHEILQPIDPSAAISLPHYAKPMYSDPENACMQDLKQAAESVEGQPFSFVRRNGGSDVSNFTKVGGLGCEFGIAGEDQHSDNEHISLEAFEHYLQTLRAFVKNTEARLASS